MQKLNPNHRLFLIGGHILDAMPYPTPAYCDGVPAFQWLKDRDTGALHVCLSRKPGLPEFIVSGPLCHDPEELREKDRRVPIPASSLAVMGGKSYHYVYKDKDDLRNDIVETRPVRSAMSGFDPEWVKWIEEEIQGIR